MKKSVKVSIYIVCVTIVLFFISFYWIDRPLAHGMRDISHSGAIYQFFNSITYLADAQGTLIFVTFGLIISILISIPDKNHPIAKNLRFFFITLALAIIMKNGLKYIIGRYRPEVLFSHQHYGFHYLTKKGKYNSSPSGHVTFIFAAATALSIIWKKAAWFFFLIAVLVAISRLVLLQHYLADVIFGAGLGMLSAIWCKELWF